MKTDLRYHDIYPKVVPEGVETEITIRPLGAHAVLPPQTEIGIYPVQQRPYPLSGMPSQITKLILDTQADGVMRFRHTFCGEQEHYICFKLPQGKSFLRIRLGIYSVKKDLLGRIPLMGDQHVHTSRVAKVEAANPGILEKGPEAWCMLLGETPTEALSDEESDTQFRCWSRGKTLEEIFCVLRKWP